MSKKKYPIIIKQFDDSDELEFFSWGHHSEADMIEALKQSNMCCEKFRVIDFNQEYARYSISSNEDYPYWMIEPNPGRGKKPVTEIRVEEVYDDE